MADDFDSFLAELAGTPEWSFFRLPPEGDPQFWPEVPQLFYLDGDTLDYFPSLESKLTEHSRERLRALRAGSLRVEAQGPRTTKYSLVPLGYRLCL